MKVYDTMCDATSKSDRRSASNMRQKKSENRRAEIHNNIARAVFSTFRRTVHGRNSRVNSAACIRLYKCVADRQTFIANFLSDYGHHAATDRLTWKPLCSMHRYQRECFLITSNTLLSYLILRRVTRTHRN